LLIYGDYMPIWRQRRCALRWGLEFKTSAVDRV